MGFVAVLDEWWDVRHQVSAAAERVYLELLKRKDYKMHECIISVSTLAESLRIGRSTAADALRKLETIGVVRIIRRGANQYAPTVVEVLLAHGRAVPSIGHHAVPVSEHQPDSTDLSPGSTDLSPDTNRTARSASRAETPPRPTDVDEEAAEGPQLPRCLDVEVKIGDEMRPARDHVWTALSEQWPSVTPANALGAKFAETFCETCLPCCDGNADQASDCATVVVDKMNGGQFDGRPFRQSLPLLRTMLAEDRQDYSPRGSGSQSTDYSCDFCHDTGRARKSGTYDEFEDCPRCGGGMDEASAAANEERFRAIAGGLSR